MDRLLNDFGPKAKAATSRAGFEEVVEEMIHGFNDSHFDFYSHSDQGFYLMAGLANPEGSEALPNIGAWYEHTSEGWSVKMVLDGGEAMRVGLRKGDVIKTIDGTPFTPVDSLAPKVGQTVTLEALRGGLPITVQVKVAAQPCMEMFLDASRASARIIEDHGKKIGYYHLWTEANDRFRIALSDAVYGKLRSTDGFILDLRDGFGGRPEGYGDPFFRPELWVEWNNSPKSGYKQLYGYQRPLVVLINSGSRSAKEILSYAFKTSKRGTLVGRTTAGNVLGTFPMKINDWAFIEIPVVDVVVDNVRLEKKGVPPDVLVPKEMDEKGNDLDLKIALDRLKNVKAYKGEPAGIQAKTTSAG